MAYIQVIISVLFLAFGFPGFGQVDLPVAPVRCGTVERLETKFIRNPALKTRFETERSRFNTLVAEESLETPGIANKTSGTFIIPVVFHIVHTNPSIVTDQQIAAQLDTLNKAFSGLNGDTTRIPSYFKNLFGRSGIQFCLAQRTPDGENSTGINRITTTRTSFSVNDDFVKYTSTGGLNIWDPTRYLNIWICTISTNILGYATFPGDGNEAEQGVVIDYRSLPGAAFTNYNGGKSLVHETGHYFNLYHIWGDDNGCSGSDFVDDTPNQSTSTAGCVSGIKTDNCTPSGNGVMYQNYMDYSYDACMVMFTAQQVSRIESALSLYRSSLLISDACEPVNLHNFDAQLLSINAPAQRICNPSFIPSITIRNKGTQRLTSLNITIKIDDITVGTSSWTGSLTRSSTAEISLPSFTANAGNHVLSIIISDPTNNADQESSDNALSAAFQYYEPVDTIMEGFESSIFPPTGWDIVTANKETSWRRVTGAAKTGGASVMIDNFSNTTNGQRDQLRLPDLTIASSVDTSFLSFQVAASAFSTSTQPDTLEIAVSTDCGSTYATVYQKWGSTLNTVTARTNAFTPSASDWRKDSVDLSRYIGAGKLLIAFKYSHRQGNNIYLDDIQLRNITVNPNLKTQGFLVTPNPTSGSIAVQFYPQPTNLRAIEIYSMAGQKLTQINTSNGQSNYYKFDLTKYAAGTYIVRAIFTDKVLMKKIIRY